MTPDEALAILEVPAQASTTQLRDAYRQMMRRYHPDLAGPTGARRATLVIEAYRVLRSAPHAPVAGRSTPGAGRSPTGPPPSGPTATGPTATGRDGRAAQHAGRPDNETDVVTVAADTAAVFAQLCEAAEVLGDVRLLDAASGLLETIVAWDGWPPSSLRVQVARRGDDTVAHCTLDSLTAQPAPPIRRVVAELHRVMEALAE